MLKIAFIDHHLNNFHADTFLRLLREPGAAGQAQVTVAWESSPLGEDWCVKNGVRRAATLQEAVDEADAVMVLAPDDIEAHLAMGREVLPAGKPAFFDKMLATNLAHAEELVALARQYGSPIFSSSSLRYAAELESGLERIAGREVEDVFVRGMNEWDRYGIHTLAIALRLLGTDVSRLIDTGSENSRTVTLEYRDGRRATIDVRLAVNEWEHFGWSFAARVGKEYIGGPVVDHAAIYSNLMRSVVHFFTSGQSDMPVEEALIAVAVIEGANRSLRGGRNWVEIARPVF